MDFLDLCERKGFPIIEDSEEEKRCLHLTFCQEKSISVTVRVSTIGLPVSNRSVLAPIV